MQNGGINGVWGTFQAMQPNLMKQKLRFLYDYFRNNYSRFISKPILVFLVAII